MKKTISIIAVIATVGSLTFAGDNESASLSVKLTSSVNGTVIDKNSGEVLAGVAVKLTGTNIVVYSDLDGNFEIGGLKPGKYAIESEMISYKKASEEIQIKPEKENSIELEMENL